MHRALPSFAPAALAALVLFAFAPLPGCGARSQLIAPDLPDAGSDAAPPEDAGTLQVACPAAIFTTQTATETITATVNSSRHLPINLLWQIERGPMESHAAPMPADQATTRVTFDVGGQYQLRFRATESDGRSASCTTRVYVDPAIDLLCPQDQSNYQGATITLNATARSRLMRTVTTMWTVESRPPMSTSAPTPPNALTGVTMLLDQLGDWQLRLTATDSMGITATCVTRVHADPDVIVMCPPDATSAPFATINLAGMASSRRMLPLTFRWEIADNPITSTATIAQPTQRTTPFTFDVAGNWTFRFTATNNQGNSASCTTRATAASSEAVRVELVWNVDHSCVGCNAQGGGIDLDLHLADVSRAMGHWASAAPGMSDCYYADCRCGSPGTLCPNGGIDWPPMGVPNNPQLDVDHISDLPGPENINVIDAAVGAQYDVGVHFFGDNTPGQTAPSTPTVARVYCHGAPVFESEPVRLERGGAGSGGNNLWRVGRITITASGCTFERCGRPGALGDCIRPESSW